MGKIKTEERDNKKCFLGNFTEEEYFNLLNFNRENSFGRCQGR
jgi:hypothetical protein